MSSLGDEWSTANVCKFYIESDIENPESRRPHSNYLTSKQKKAPGSQH